MTEPSYHYKKISKVKCKNNFLKTHCITSDVKRTLNQSFNGNQNTKQKVREGK